MKMLTQIVTGIFVLLILISCSSTKLSQTWSDPGNRTSYKNIMIVGISDSEQTRRVYESHFVAGFQEKGIDALASYKLISHKDEQKLDGKTATFREIIETAIKGRDVDAVLMTHVAWIDEEEVYRPSLASQPAVYSPTAYQTTYVQSSGSSMYGYHATVVSNVQLAGAYSEDRTYTLESNLYDVHTEELVWTTRSRSFAPESVDQVVREVAVLIIDDLVSRELIK